MRKRIPAYLRSRSASAAASVVPLASISPCSVYERSAPAPRGETEARFGEVWKITRASARRGDAEVRVIQAKIDARPKLEHTDRKEACKLNLQSPEACRAKLIGQSVDMFSAAYRADPRDPGIAGNLSLALLDAGRLKEAEVALMEALAIEPSRVGARTVLGMVLVQQCDAPAALDALLNAHRY